MLRKRADGSHVRRLPLAKCVLNQLSLENSDSCSAAAGTQHRLLLRVGGTVMRVVLPVRLQSCRVHLVGDSEKSDSAQQRGEPDEQRVFCIMPCAMRHMRHLVAAVCAVRCARALSLSLWTLSLARTHARIRCTSYTCVYAAHLSSLVWTRGFTPVINTDLYHNIYGTSIYL